MKRIGVFCGSSLGYHRAYKQAAEHLATLLVENEIELVYGGANVGLMKVLANKVMDLGGRVIGVMPQTLVDKEVAHNGISMLHVVDSMAERKQLMVELSDAFIALPGGFGTLDELSEILTYNQLRISDKPLGILNVSGYFDFLLRFFDHGVSEGFVREEHRSNMIVSFDCNSLIKKMSAYEPVSTGKWIDEIRENA